MDNMKREFFESRALNHARIAAEAAKNSRADPPVFPVSTPSTALWTETETSSSLAAPSESSLLFAPSIFINQHSSATFPETITPAPQPPKLKQPPVLKPIPFTPQKMVPTVIVEKKETHSKPVEEKVKENTPPPADVTVAVLPAAPEEACDQDGDYEDDIEYETHEYYCDMLSENEDAIDTDMFEAPTAPAPTSASVPKPAGYNKFSIDDMMNHESPALASPPPSETEVKTTAAPPPTPVMAEIGELPNAPPPTLKRKREADAPEVVEGVDYPELAPDGKEEQAEEMNEEEEEEDVRPAKRVKEMRRGASYAGLAAAAVAGAVVGGMGMFAALVASAQ